MKTCLRGCYYEFNCNALSVSVEFLTLSKLKTKGRLGLKSIGEEIFIKGKHLQV